MKAHYSSFLSAIWKRPTAAAAKAIPAVILSLSCLALASCGDGGGKELLSGRARLVRPGAQRLQSFCQEDE